MAGDDSDAGFTSLTVSGWHVVRLTRDLDGAMTDGLRAHVAPLLAAGTPIVLDLRHHEVAPDALAGLGGIDSAARIARSPFAIVADVGLTRDALRAAGLADVHESIDDAVHDTASALRQASRAEVPPLAPAAGDAMLVAAEDVADVEP